MRILLVEDNARLRAIVGQTFAGNGFAVGTAEPPTQKQRSRLFPIWR
jgi:DNA-binding response OmpR family regulator